VLDHIWWGIALVATLLLASPVMDWMFGGTVDDLEEEGGQAIINSLVFFAGLGLWLILLLLWAIQAAVS